MSTDSVCNHWGGGPPPKEGVNRQSVSAVAEPRSSRPFLKEHGPVHIMLLLSFESRGMFSCARLELNMVFKMTIDLLRPENVGLFLFSHFLSLCLRVRKHYVLRSVEILTTVLGSITQLMGKLRQGPELSFIQGIVAFAQNLTCRFSSLPWVGDKSQMPAVAQRACPCLMGYLEYKPNSCAGDREGAEQPTYINHLHVRLCVPPRGKRGAFNMSPPSRSPQSTGGGNCVQQ